MNSQLETDAGDLVDRRRLCKRITHGLIPGEFAYYGSMPVRIIETGDPTLVYPVDPDGVAMAGIDVAGDEFDRIEELQDELDRAYERRLNEL